MGLGPAGHGVGFENFILRAMGNWIGFLWLLCTKTGKGLGVEFGAEDRQKSGSSEPSGLSLWQWEEAYRRR